MTAIRPGLFMPMLDTAEIVAERYGISREEQNAYASSSPNRTAQAQSAGLFDDEIAPIRTTKSVKNHETGEIQDIETEHSIDEGKRPNTTLESLTDLEPVQGAGKTVTAGNASQLSDGAAALVLMDAGEAERRRLAPLRVYRGMAVSGLRPDELVIGPVLAVPRLLERYGLSVEYIDLWEANEAFAVQVVYCRDKLGIPDELLNVNDGGISMGIRLA